MITCELNTLYLSWKYTSLYLLSMIFLIKLMIENSTYYNQHTYKVSLNMQLTTFY